MVFLICLIAMLNLCLGYAVAVLLGYGPPGIREGWDVLTGKLPPEPLPPTIAEGTASVLEGLGAEHNATAAMSNS